MKKKNPSHNLKSRVKTLKLMTILLVFLVNFGAADLTFASPIEESALVDLANKSRLENGAEPLHVNLKLKIAARNKAEDMLKNDYFEHYSPLGVSPWDFIKTAGYDYVMAGENLAMDFQTSEGIHRAWMNSPLHKKNILRDGYEDIGIATVKGDFIGQETTMVVQMFGKPLKNTNKINTIIWKVTSWILGL